MLMNKTDKMKRLEIRYMNHLRANMGRSNHLSVRSFVSEDL